jgi:putative transcription antitermination factor YqgF
MKILSVDWGQKRIGLALSYDNLAEPYGVVSSFEELSKVAKKEGVERVILGLPEGVHKKEVEDFGRRIQGELGIPMVFRSEVLTSRVALSKALEAGKSRKARRNLDAASAAVLLQEYLDQH